MWKLVEETARPGKKTDRTQSRRNRCISIEIDRKLTFFWCNLLFRNCIEEVYKAFLTREQSQFLIKSELSHCINLFFILCISGPPAFGEAHFPVDSLLVGGKAGDVSCPFLPGK